MIYQTNKTCSTVPVLILSSNIDLGVVRYAVVVVVVAVVVKTKLRSLSVDVD